MSVVQELLKRRVPQICGIYLGAIFAGVEFTDMMVERYGLSDRWVDGVLIGMLACLPTVIMVAWGHGAPGRDQWRKQEMLGIPLNLVAAAALVMALVPQKPLEAASQVRSATDENGLTVTVEVPQPGLVERVAVFFMNPEGFATDTPWEAYGLSLLIEEGLEADDFAETYTLYRNYSEGNIWKLKRAGYASGLNAPLSLLSDVANTWHQDYFVTGALRPLENERWRTDLKLYRVGTLDLLLEVALEADSLFALSDAATSAVMEKIRRPTDSNRLTTRLPAEELLSSNLEALRLFVEGKNAITLETDIDGALALWEQAVALDPGFNQAYLAMASVNEGMGNNDAALANLKELNRLSHELNEEQKIRIKAWTYSLKNEPDRATRVFEMWTELYPDNHDAWASLGYSYLNNGNRISEAISSFQESIKIMPNQPWLVNQMAGLQRIMGNNDEAIESYEKYHEQLPQNYLPLIAIGDIKTDLGDLQGAEDYYQQGQLAQTNMVTPIIKLAFNQAQRGNVSEAMALLDEAEFVAEAPRQLSSLAAARGRLHAILGQPSAALEQIKKQYEIESQSLSQIDAIVGHLRSIELYSLAGKDAEAEAFLKQVEPGFRPPYDFIPSVGYMILRTIQGDLDEAEFHNQKIARGLAESGRTDLEFVVDFSMGLIHRERGEMTLALEKLRRAAASFQTSAQFTDEYSRAEYEQINIGLTRTLLLIDRPDEALQALNPLLLSWPNHPEGNWLAAQAHHQKGNTIEAEKALRIAQRMWADAEAGFEPAEQARKGFADQY